ncbi:unnamed protein product [Blepharisma stoltei]|uniref:Uncharacterized protein n=1 Tax=Blepharisma stoltei TaxID=1481888 RepID=A0AAU9J9S1_9CILI|nr:unnamed protein product [Blepharisma stoltei]
MINAKAQCKLLHINIIICDSMPWKVYYVLIIEVGYHAKCFIICFYGNYQNLPSWLRFKNYNAHQKLKRMAYIMLDQD